MTAETPAVPLHFGREAFGADPASAGGRSPHAPMPPPDERARLRDGPEELAARSYGGRVERNMVTAIYTAARPL